MLKKKSQNFIRFMLAIKTINFRSGWCVIDGLNKKSDSLRAVIRILYKKMKIID